MRQLGLYRAAIFHGPGAAHISVTTWGVIGVARSLHASLRWHDSCTTQGPCQRATCEGPAHLCTVSFLTHFPLARSLLPAKNMPRATGILWCTPVHCVNPSTPLGTVLASRKLRASKGLADTQESYQPTLARSLLALTNAPTPCPPTRYAHSFPRFQGCPTIASTPSQALPHLGKH